MNFIYKILLILVYYFIRQDSSDNIINLITIYKNILLLLEYTTNLCTHHFSIFETTLLSLPNKSNMLPNQTSQMNPEKQNSPRYLGTKRHDKNLMNSIRPLITQRQI